jgi:membrane-associated phospholipid phosphatase
MHFEPTRTNMFHRPVSETDSSHGRIVIVVIVTIMAVVALATHFFTPLSWDVATTRAAQSVSATGLKELMRLISGFGNAPKVIAVTMVALFACNKRRQALFLGLSGLGGWALAMALKRVFAAPRPTSELVSVFHHWPTGSFPSGHLVFYVCYFGFLFFLAREELPRTSLLRKCILVVTASLALLVGVSRLYLGEHWFSDLPGSYLLGVLWLALCLKLYRAWTRAQLRQNDWFLPYRTTDK